MPSATRLLSDVRALGNLPAATGLSDSVILAHADLEISSRFIPLLRRVNEEYMVRTINVAAVNGRVRLPSRAVMASVRHVQLLVSGSYITLPQLGMEKATTTDGGQPVGFYFDATGLVLLPLGASGTVRIQYYARPGKLTNNSADYATITLVNGQTAAGADVDYGGGFSGGACDVISSGSDHAQIAIDAVLSGSAITGDIQGQIVAGDLICAADKTFLIPLPEELYSSLVHRTSSRVLLALGYLEESNAQAQLAEIGLSEAVHMFSPRSLGNPKRPSGGMLSIIGSGRNWSV